ncbi:MAG: GNAT family N-acetyltransferase [Candidatus Rokubacteria bacterium]|nr:GNAT family N-acetyltransferase [Candidatus Rokubacteria bacterium]
MSPPTGRVRPMDPEDVPRVAALYATVFGVRGAGALEGLRQALDEMFFRHPWDDDRLPSLVYETRSRAIVGCLGVMPRPMCVNGRRVQAAISHTCMVDPGSRTTLAGMDLIRAFLSGPQDVSIAQGTDRSRRIFEAVGGSTSLLHSMGWTRLLRPSRYALAFLGRHGLPAVVSAALTPWCRAADALAGRILPHPFRRPAAGPPGERLDPESLAACVADVARDRALRPIYDGASLKWLLELLARQDGDVVFDGSIVRDASAEIIGAYLYYRHASGVGDVVQLLARPTSVTAVFDHLFNDAYRHGLVAVSGQLDPRLVPALGARQCLFTRGDGSWLLLHSREPDLLAAVYRGDALLTRLEAEWWIGFVLARSLFRGGADADHGA